jgi:hypothetical protein
LLFSWSNTPSDCSKDKQAEGESKKGGGHFQKCIQSLVLSSTATSFAFSFALSGIYIIVNLIVCIVDTVVEFSH